MDWLSGGDTRAEDALESDQPRDKFYQGSKVTTTGILNGDSLLEKKCRRPVNQLTVLCNNSQNREPREAGLSVSWKFECVLA